MPNGTRLVMPLRRMFRRQMRTSLDRLYATQRRKAVKYVIWDVMQWLATDLLPVEHAEIAEAWRQYYLQGAKRSETEGPIAVSLDLPSPRIRESVGLAMDVLKRNMAKTTAERAKEVTNALKIELPAGMLLGESIRVLSRRVSAVFQEAERYRAVRIAQTEAIRALHRGQIDYAMEKEKALDVTIGKQWLASADACPLCRQIARESQKKGPVTLTTSFYEHADAPDDYRDVPSPPAHPNCRCTITEVVINETPAKPAATRPAAPPPQTTTGPAPTKAPGITFSRPFVADTKEGRFGEKLRKMLAERPVVVDGVADIERVLDVGRLLYGEIDQNLPMPFTGLAGVRRRLREIVVDPNATDEAKRAAAEEVKKMTTSDLLKSLQGRGRKIRAAVASHLREIRDLAETLQSEGVEIVAETPQDEEIAKLLQDVSLNRGAIMPKDHLRIVAKHGITARRMTPSQAAQYDGYAIVAESGERPRHIIGADPSATRPVVFHEVQHLMDGDNAIRQRAMHDYYERRTAGQERYPMDPMFGNKEPTWWKQGNPPWFRNYMGRSYPYTTLTEISTSVQQYLGASDDVDIWDLDPESVQFVLGLWACL